MPGPRTMFLLTAAVAGIGACAPVAAPVHFRLPGAPGLPISGAELEGRQQEQVVLGPLHVAARAGIYLIEIRIHNTGADDVLLDWTGSSFISPSGRSHALVTEEWLLDGRDRSMPLYGVMRGDAADVASSTVPLRVPGAPAAHMPPTGLHMQQQPLQRIGPGDVHVAVLYPAEHVIDAGFRMHAGTSLLCDASPTASLPVGLRLRWHGATGWRTDQLAGTLPVRTARRGGETPIR
jgi:hypothetical protein